MKIKIRWIGVLFVIFCLIIIYAGGIFVNYLVFHTGEYGKYNECANSVNRQYSYELGKQDRGFEKLQEKIIEICGNNPPMNYENLRALSNSLERQVLKGDPIGAEMSMVLFISWYLVMLLFGFIVGYIIEKIVLRQQ
ncbi:MAG: hypothetical protein V1845_03360 [bacterium]